MTFIVLTLLALSWVTFDLQSPASVRNGPRQGALQLFGPVQRTLAVVGGPVNAATRWLSDQRHLHRELTQLRGARARARSVASVNDDLVAENRELRALLSMRARGPHRGVGATVLGAPPGDPSGTVVLTAGTADGVAPDMAVVDDTALVGRIVAATRSYARVELVTSPAARYAVRVGGEPSGRLWGGRSLLRLELDDVQRPARPGAAVVTRAFEGSPIPDGIPIGTVATAPTHERYVDVEPLVDTGSLSVVQVLTGAAEHPVAAAIGSTGRASHSPGSGDR